MSKVVLYQSRYKNANENDDSFGKFTEWVNCDRGSYLQKNQLINAGGYSYETRSLGVIEYKEINT